MLSKCTDQGLRMIFNPKLDLDSYLSPAAKMLAYFVTTLSLIHRARYQLTFTALRVTMKSEVEKTPTPDEQHGSATTIESPSMLEQLFYMVFDITAFIYKHSYVLMNIMMMIWSIVFHSWLTFVLLIWANILWMIPNQRRSMMRSSFFIVVYAEFLVISQYIYGMNFKQAELPIQFFTSGLNMEQIGFVHSQSSGNPPFLALSVKTLFLLTFWITSRQYFKEKAEDNRHNTILSQIFGSQHAQSEHTIFEKSRAQRFFIFVFESIRNFITRIWMWMLIFLIFLCAIFEQYMNGFRICYMSLFLLFLMIFQISLHVWIRFLYGYWIFVIFYAMSILTVIYTYQFDHFDHYWEKYLGVKIKLQSDIGLNRYKTKDLFLRLLIPTLTVIFTVVQLHYFHKPFMAAMWRSTPTDRVSHASLFHLNVAPTSDNQRENSTAIRKLMTFFVVTYRKIRSKARRLFRPGKRITWRFLEMHMIKAVILSLFNCAIAEICLFNIPLVILSLLSVSVNSFLRRLIFRIVTFWISVLVLMKMVYQIKYLERRHYDFICKNDTVNFAEWVGLKKTEPMWIDMLRYISPYIIYMVVASLHAVVKLRDHLIRAYMRDYRDQKVLFPDTERQDAERDFPGLVKYLCNYGFFKFGIEITLVGLIATISHRRDLIAVTYLLWFILILFISRVQCARIWDILQLYFILSILLQYIYFLSFPPNLCIVAPYEVPQDSTILTNWSLLTTSMQAFYRSKMFIDFIVLMIISRQRKAFRTEMRHFHDQNFGGGDNKSVVNNTAMLGHIYFDNPTHDFCSYVRNYADVFKTAVFCSFFWITLSVVFLAGVCSMDILSLGYLIFALVFLLKGSETYLRNIHSIICRWNCLIVFNVFNIAIKICVMILAGNMDLQDTNQVVNYILNVVHYRPAMKPDTEHHYGPNGMVFNNGMTWHAIVFAFLIFQLRLFRSYYFCHIIMDTQANSILASRGAAIIDSLHYKQIYDRREHDKNVLHNLKAKMERIRAVSRKNYKKVNLSGTRTPIYAESAPSLQTVESAHVQYTGVVKVVHTDDIVSVASSYGTSRATDVGPLLSRRRDLRLHPHVVRTGDYYMFDEVDDADDMDEYQEYDFLERQEIRERQIRLKAQRSKQYEFPTQTASGENFMNAQSAANLYYSSSDSGDEDFDTHPVVKLTGELIVLLTIRLNRLSRNYRFVHKVLSAEKKALQEISTMNRLGLSNTAAMFTFLNLSLNTRTNASRDAVSRGESVMSLVSKGDDFTTREHNDLVKMLIALWYSVIANTEVICYLAVFINQAANSSIISLPMPLLILFWGALTLPRPIKLFWVTLITYALAMIVLKMLIVLGMNLIKRGIPNDQHDLIMKHGKALYDMILLVVLFWHRYMLKKQGIWDVQRLSAERPIRDRYPSNQKYSKDKPAEILKRLRQEAGVDFKENPEDDSANVFERDMDEVLQPGAENKYVYRKIETEYYRRAMYQLEHKGGCLSGLYKFFFALRHKARLSTDVYSLMFFCDFINFFVLLFGFPKFAYRYRYSTSVIHSYIQENKVPFSFLIMLIVQFLTIVIERAIYLRKALVHKIVFHYITVVGIHFWMFFLVPYLTARSFGAAAHVIFYMIKCLHMLLSAYQIRCGYPKRILGNVFTKSYSLFNLVAFKIFMEIPFLYILRTMLDWVCTDTTLTLMEWIKMEDIFQSVFIVRCYRQMDTDFPVLRGIPKALYTKLLLGGTIILILIMLIWSPLFLFALVGTVGKPNLPQKADITVKMGHYEPVYVSQSYSGIKPFMESEYQKLQSTFSVDSFAHDHIAIYDAGDITAVKFDANSVTMWNMLPPDKKRLLDDLKRGHKMEIRVMLTITCGERADKIQYETVYSLTTNKWVRNLLIQVISNDNSDAKVVIPDILPKFVTVSNLRMNVRFIKDFDEFYWIVLYVFKESSCVR
ncbi:piezo-type mechanosensitive ion channel component isoform X1 [Scaptodrosophila lebanonensis]|uniref:Piezo-type mechanosensitive ion channel component isoform X1 n=1 Tax=Drosophila lebanonensis TaxID=7225 RepID=A0A6J2UEZ5_DROLE|nr:piezo-type mechanosensitive ion channel component isoform X1 [Scaptodrosophila lebanonensis]